MKIKASWRLAALICAGMMLLASCGGGGDSETTTTKSQGDASQATTTEATTTENPYDENGFLKDTIDPSINYEGKNFNVFIWKDQQTWDFRDGEENGDLINDAVLKRQKTVEDRLGVKFVVNSQAGSWSDRNTFIQTIENATSAGSKDFDLVGQYTPAASIGAMKGLYLDLVGLTQENEGGLNLSMPWWPQNIQDSSTIYGKLYFATGAITPTTIRNVGAIMVNMDLVKKLKLDDPFEVVQSGKWTMEKVMQMSIGTTKGLNADGTQAYGFIFENNVKYDDLFYGAGFRFIDPLADGSIKLSDGLTSEKLINWFDTCRNFLLNNGDVAIVGINQAFTTGNGLMYFGQVAHVQNYLRNVDFDFEIVPTPKYDEAQKEYYTLSSYWNTMFSIPGIANDPECSSYVLEALASEGYRQLRPAIYEDAFQYKYLATEKNAIMYDLINNSLVFDIGRTFADALGMFSTFREAAKDNSVGWSTIYQSKVDAWQANISTVLGTLS